MAFPVDPSSVNLDSRGLFLIQDAKLQERILPLFSFDPENPEQRPKGHGTTFRIDPWFCCATAFHVLEDLFQVNRAGSAISLRPDISLAALAIHKTGYGLVPVSEDSWRPLAGSYGVARIEQPLVGEARIRNLTELMALRIVSPDGYKEAAPYLPVDFCRWRPSIGESILALGYADLDDDKGIHDEGRPISQYLYGSIGVITDIESADGTRSSPWPMIRIDANWPGGMSGGPVFNEAGNVVGLVSAGFEGVRGATATIFSGWDMPGRIFSSIDPSNPGAFLCWGGFDAAGELVLSGQNKASVEKFCLEQGHPEFGLVSFNPATGDVVRLGPCGSLYA